MRRLLGVAAAIVLVGASCGKDLPTSPISELQIIDLQVGTGATAVAGKVVTVNYTGWVYSTTAPDHKGTQFDASANHGGPFEFDLGIGEVIKGWDVGIVGMKVGGKRELIIPPSMGYGKSAYGPIPANSALVFDVELVSVQ